MEIRNKREGHRILLLTKLSFIKYLDTLLEYISLSASMSVCLIRSNCLNDQIASFKNTFSVEQTAEPPYNYSISMN